MHMYLDVSYLKTKSNHEKKPLMLENCEITLISRLHDNMYWYRYKYSGIIFVQLHETY